MKLTIKQLQGQLKTSRDLADEQRKALTKAYYDAATYKGLYESQQRYNKTISDDLNHQRRLVQTLLDALADQIHPRPTNN